MTIDLQDIGKRYGREWIFRHIDLTIEPGDVLAITGYNGSGKSTLLKIISSYMDPSEGIVVYSSEKGALESDQVISSINYCAPYVNLIEELTLEEHLKFHFTFKDTRMDLREIAVRALLEKAWNKHVGEFSSGMKQRLKLALSLFSEASLIILDEPTSNMDEQGVEWYLQEISQISSQAPILIASNQRYEYDFAEKVINLSSKST